MCLEPDQLQRYEHWMALALEEARRAERDGDVPVGAVIVKEETLIAQAHNSREMLGDPTAHAEILAMRAAGEVMGTWHLEECEMFVTLEPCVMCAGALVWARIQRVIFGATDPKAGGTVSLYTIPTDIRLNHRLEVVPGIRENECQLLLQTFFRRRRSKSGNKKT